MLNNFSSHARWKQLTIASLGIISVGFSQSALSAPLGNQQDIINLSAGVKNADFTRVTSSQVESQLKSASNKLNSLEAAISKVENSKVVSSAEADQISKDTLEYAQNIKQALDVALKEASTLAESKGAKGSIGSLETFEKVEKANFPRLQQLDQKAKSVELKIKNGEFRLSNASLQQLSPADRQSFVNEINAPARQIYIQQRPDLFNGINIKQNIKTPESSLKSIDKSSIGGMNISGNLNLPIGIADESKAPQLISIAAAPCVGLALEKKYVALATCVINAGSEATNIYNEFKSCWNASKGWSNWLKRAACVARLIARIA